MASPRRTTAVSTTDLVDVLDQINDVQTTATCARLILAGIQSIEAGPDPYDPLARFLLRLESEVDTLAKTATDLSEGAA